MFEFGLKEKEKGPCHTGEFVLCLSLGLFLNSSPYISIQTQYFLPGAGKLNISASLLRVVVKSHI